MGDHLLLDKGQHSVTPAESEGANLEESEKQLKKDHSFIPQSSAWSRQANEGAGDEHQNGIGPEKSHQKERPCRQDIGHDVPGALLGHGDQALHTRATTATRMPQKAYRTAGSSSNWRSTKLRAKMMTKLGSTTPTVAAAFAISSPQTAKKSKRLF